MKNYTMHEDRENSLKNTLGFYQEIIYLSVFLVDASVDFG